MVEVCSMKSNRKLVQEYAFKKGETERNVKRLQDQLKGFWKLSQFVDIPLIELMEK